MKILITGGAGFIGRWLIRKLAAEAEVIVVDSLGAPTPQTGYCFDPETLKRVTWIKADIRDKRAYANALIGTSVIVHLASSTGTGQSMYKMEHYIENNVGGTAALLELVHAMKQKPQRIILASSRAVYGEGAYSIGSTINYPKGRLLEDLKEGRWDVYDKKNEKQNPLPMQESQPLNPTSIYGLTKLWQEQIIQLFSETEKIDFAIFRFQNVYGPEQDLHNPYSAILNVIANSILQNRKVHLFEDGNITRDFVYVEDVVEAVVKSIFYSGLIAKKFNFGSGKATTLKELAQIIAQAANKKLLIKCSGQFRIGDIRHAVADMKLYEATFGAGTPTPLAAGVGKYLEWYRQQTPPPANELAKSLKEMKREGMFLKSKSKCIVL